MEQALSKENIQTITETIDKAEISFSHLRDDLIDHMCCEVESLMLNGLDFQNAFAEIKRDTGIKTLQEVQEKTMLLIDKKYCAMKKMMKVSGVVSTSMLMLASVFKIQHWPGASILLVLGFFVLCALFLPSANYVMVKEKKDKNVIVLFISGIVASLVFFIGVLFKIMHWPGANILLPIGDVLLALVFLPLLLIHLNKAAKSRKEKLAYAIAVFSGIVYLFGFISKFFHWPGASILLMTGALTIVFVFIPSYTFIKYKSEKYIKPEFIYIIVAMSWFVIFTALISLNVSTEIGKTFNAELKEMEQSVSIIESQNEQIIRTIMDQSAEFNMQEVVVQSDELCTYIENIKRDIIVTMNRHSNRQESMDASGELSKDKVSLLDDYSSVYSVMIGDGKSGKGYELVKMVEAYKSLLLKNAENDLQTSRLVNILLDLSDPGTFAGTEPDWVRFYFGYHSTVINGLQLLTTLQRNIRLAENEVLSYVSHQINI